MSKSDIFEFFFQGSTALSARNILLILGAALALAAVIFVTYRLTHTGSAYSAKFNATNVAVTLITTVIMMMISSNIVISLGMVGALSIIRFRTAVKDPWDTVYIFWGVVEGLCAGSQNFKLALISTLFIAVALIILSSHMIRSHKYLLVIRSEGDADAAAVEAAIAKFYKHHKLRAANNSREGRELIYEIRVRKSLDTALISALQEVSGVRSVNFLEETGETVG